MKCIAIVFLIFQTTSAINFDSLIHTNGIQVEIDAVKELRYYRSLPAYFRIKVKNICPLYTFIDSEYKSRSLSEWSFIKKTWSLDGGCIQNVNLLSNYAPSVQVIIKKQSGEVIKDVFIKENAYQELVTTYPPDNGATNTWPEKEKRTKTPLHSGEWHIIHYDLGPYLQNVIPGEYVIRVVFIPQLQTPNEIYKEFKINIFDLDTIQAKLLAQWHKLYSSFYNKVENDYFQQTTKKAMLFRNDFNFKLLFLKEKLNVEEIYKQKDSLSPDVFSSVIPFIYLNFAINESTLPIRSELLKFFPEILYPLALCLEYEMEFTLKNKDKAKKLKDQILSTYPEYMKKIEDVDSGNGIIKRLKQIIAEK